MITVSHRTGRVGEFRFERTITLEQMKGFAAQMSELVVGFGQRMVFVVDFRECEPVEPQIEAMFVGQIRSDNWALEKSAFLLRPASPTMVQMERVIALGRNAARQSFTSLENLLAWVSPILTDDEVQRVSNFFLERS